MTLLSCRLLLKAVATPLAVNRKLLLTLLISSSSPMISNSILEVCLLAKRWKVWKEKKNFDHHQRRRENVYLLIRSSYVKIELKTSEGRVPGTFERNNDPRAFLINEAEFALVLWSKEKDGSCRWPHGGAIWHYVTWNSIRSVSEKRGRLASQ